MTVQVVCGLRNTGKTTFVQEALLPEQQTDNVVVFTTSPEDVDSYRHLGAQVSPDEELGAYLNQRLTLCAPHYSAPRDDITLNGGVTWTELMTELLLTGFAPGVDVEIGRFLTVYVHERPYRAGNFVNDRLDLVPLHTTIVLDEFNHFVNSTHINLKLWTQSRQFDVDVIIIVAKFSMLSPMLRSNLDVVWKHVEADPRLNNAGFTQSQRFQKYVLT